MFSTQTSHLLNSFISTKKIGISLSLVYWGQGRKTRVYCFVNWNEFLSPAPGEISSNLYCAPVCDMKKWTFLLISLSQILYYTLQTTWYRTTKNIFGKLPDHWWLQINTFNFEGCHTLTHIFQIHIMIMLFNPIDC